MVLETAQLLSTAHRVLDGTKVDKKWILNDDREQWLYKATHINHPCAVWTRTSVENYNWLYDHLCALDDSYYHRYNKRHKVFRTPLAWNLGSPPFSLKEWNWTLPPSCMPEEYIIGNNPVMNYRNYYKNAKKHLHKWTNCDPPPWI